MKRRNFKGFLASIGHPLEPGQEGAIEALRWDERVTLVLETNLWLNEAYGWWRQGQDEDVLDAFPCEELIRLIDRKEQRNWYERWRGAGGIIYPGAPNGYPLVDGVSTGGRCIARKDSPVWERISAFGQPYPPFDFGSGIDVRDVGYLESVELGVIPRGAKITPQRRDFAPPTIWELPVPASWF